jgi:hypothetical protein
MAGLPEAGIDAELAWDADEFQKLWLALKSRRGAALLDSLAKCQQEHVSAAAH